MFFSSALRKLKMYQNINIWTGFSKISWALFKQFVNMNTKGELLSAQSDLSLLSNCDSLFKFCHPLDITCENFFWTKKGLNSKFPKLMERHTMTLLVCQKVWQKCQQYFLNYSQQSCVMMSPLYHSLFRPNTENTLIEDIYFLLGLFLGLFPQSRKVNLW